MISTRSHDAFRCVDCDHRWYYTKPACPVCNSITVEEYELDIGVVESTTTVYVTPDGVRSPNRLALARFANISVIAQVSDDSAELAVGDQVQLTGEYTLRDGDSEKVIGPRLGTL